MPVRLAIAPWSCPCSEALTWRVISACVEGSANPQKAMIGIPKAVNHSIWREAIDGEPHRPAQQSHKQTPSRSKLRRQWLDQLTLDDHGTDADGG